MPLELDGISDDGHEHGPPGMETEPWVQLNATPLILPNVYTRKGQIETENSHSDTPGTGTSSSHMDVLPTTAGGIGVTTMSEEEPIYHRDGGRAEFPPAYHDIPD